MFNKTIIADNIRITFNIKKSENPVNFNGCMYTRIKIKKPRTPNDYIDGYKKKHYYIDSYSLSHIKSSITHMTFTGRCTRLLGSGSKMLCFLRFRFENSVLSMVSGLKTDLWDTVVPVRKQYTL